MNEARSAQPGNMWVGNMAPGAVIGNRDNVKILTSADFSNQGIRVEVMEYTKLYGSTNYNVAQALWFMHDANIRCRQIAIYILNSGVKIEAGAMSYFQGPLEMTTGINNAGKLVSQAFTSKLTGERLAMPEYKGSGILVLEPSFNHFFVGELGPGESIIVDKGLFYAASASVEVAPVMAGKTSAALLGGEGFFQQKITGPGMIILQLPVPMNEINKVHLNNDVLKVDGNFAVLRSAGVEFSVERSAKTLVGSAVSGEGLVNVYRGTGDVWLAPTIKVYNALSAARAFGGELGVIDMNTSNGGVGVK